MDNRKNSKMNGIIAENLFINECTLRNIPVFKNQNDIGEIDYVIIKDKPIRVQIKSTMAPKKNNSYIISTKRNKNRLYKNIDYFACYIHNLKEWYLVPFEVVGSRQAISITKEHNKYIYFKSNWEFNIVKSISEVDDYNVELRNEAILLFKQGLSKAEISRRLQKHYTVINRYLREAGFGTRNLTAKKEDIVRLYNSGKTMKEVANELKITSWTMRKLFRKYNIKTRINNNPKGCHKSNKIKEL